MWWIRNRWISFASRLMPDEIPPYLPLAGPELHSSITPVRRSAIRTRLLAQQGDMRLVTSAGTENFDHIEFTHCRASPPKARSASTRNPQPPGRRPRSSQFLRGQVRAGSPDGYRSLSTPVFEHGACGQN